MSLLQKLDQVVARYAELQAALSGGGLDSQKFVAASKEYADLGPLVEAIGDWRRAEQELKDAEALGSGYQLALRDLEIRGAGNLLGSQQSGHISAVGYELYCELLEAAVRDLRKLPPSLIFCEP